jgi:glyoxylase-like metal-dependent hydrolase (beta-lactamase superfamily II)
VLLDSLAEHRLVDEDINVVVLSHLHFDHAGGLLSAWSEGVSPTLLFPKARFVVSRAAWDRANAPHARDRASFIPALQPLLEASGRLEIVDGETSATLGPDYRLHYSHGHTPGLMLVEVPGEDGSVLFCADLIPGRPWVHLPITMGYDRYPEQLIDEKTALLGTLLTHGGRLFFTHDPEVAMARLDRDDRGRYCAGESWTSLAGLPL